jgi:hypothetical protein
MVLLYPHFYSLPQFEPDNRGIDPKGCSSASSYKEKEGVGLAVALTFIVT